MGRYANYPLTVEDCLTVSISKLKEWKYLTFGFKTGSIQWSRNGENFASIRVEVKISESDSYIYFDYSSKGEPRNYKVKIIRKNSNLGKGIIYYFLCPQTKKLCRKLYLNGGYFLHRSAFKNLMYAKQIESKKYRALTSTFEKAFIPDEVHEIMYKKYFKTHYNGKPTKKYQKILDRIKLSERYPVGTLEKLLMM